MKMFAKIRVIFPEEDAGVITLVEDTIAAYGLEYTTKITSYNGMPYDPMKYDPNRDPDYDQGMSTFVKLAKLQDPTPDGSRRQVRRNETIV